MYFSTEKQVVRILHTGDWHLDSPFARLTPTKSEERRRELRDTVSRMLQLVRERDIDIVLIAGDLFDSLDVTSRTLGWLIDEMAACPRVRFVIAPGNHDPYTPKSPYASGRFPSNVSIFSTERLSSFVFPELNTAVYGWAFLSDRLESSPLAGERVAERDRLNLICGHCDFGVPLSKYGPVTSADVASFGADYAAFAHRHLPSQPTRAGETPWAYCGCPEGRSFDETGKGGVFLIEATREGEGWSLSTRRVELARRRYEKATVDLTGVASRAEVAGRIKALVEEKGYGEDTLLRVTFTGATPPDLSVPREAEGAAQVLGLYHLEIIDETTPTYDARLLETDMSVRGELYRSLLPRLTGGSEADRALAARALRLGLAAIDGNDITDL